MKISQLLAVATMSVWGLGTVQAQQDAQFSHFMFSRMYYNPAATGADRENIEFGLIHRSQWVGYSTSFSDGGYGAPTTQAFMFAAPIRKINSAIGLQAVNDRYGPLSNQEIQLTYAYHQSLGNGQLSVGFRGGLYTLAIMRDVFRYNDADDQLIESIEATAGERLMTPNFTGGVWYQNEKFFGGIGFNHLSRSNFQYANNFRANDLAYHMNLMAGMNFTLSPSWVLTPSAIVKTVFSSTSFELSTLATYNEMLYGGLSFRQGDAIIALVGMNFMNNRMRVGYGFDYILSGKQAKSGSSHEIFLGYKIPLGIPTLPPPVKTPRFHVR